MSSDRLLDLLDDILPADSGLEPDAVDPPLWSYSEADFDSALEDLKKSLLLMPRAQAPNDMPDLLGPSPCHTDVFGLDESLLEREALQMLASIENQEHDSSAVVLEKNQVSQPVAGSCVSLSSQDSDTPPPVASTSSLKGKGRAVEPEAVDANPTLDFFVPHREEDWTAADIMNALQCDLFTAQDACGPPSLFVLDKASNNGENEENIAPHEPTPAEDNKDSNGSLKRANDEPDDSRKRVR